MQELQSLVPIVAKAAVTVSGDISDFITMTKASRVVKQTQLIMLKDETEKVLADARAHHFSSLVTTNLEEIVKMQNYIDYFVNQGQLHEQSLNMAMENLCDLNDMLRRNLRDFENRKLGGF